MVILTFQKRGKLKKVFILIHFCRIESEWSALALNNYDISNKPRDLMALVSGKVNAKNIAISTTIWVEIFISSSLQLKMLAFKKPGRVIGWTSFSH